MNEGATVSLPETKRLMWVDWMKAIGIYFIVAGHFFSVGDLYIYSFNVPVFFVVSGFLSKREDSGKTFLKKIVYNMIIPMLLISFINSIIDNIFLEGGNPYDILRFPIYFILGFHRALKCLWFVYTLICLRFILQYTPANRIIQISLLIALPSLGIWLDAQPFFNDITDVGFKSNAFVDTTMAYPFFILGFYLRKKKNLPVKFNNLPIQIAGLIILLIIMVIGTNHNGYVWMYLNEYGNNFLLFLLDGLCGTIIIYIISKWLNDRFARSIITISKGTIIILGFHYYLIDLINYYLPTAHGIVYLYSLVIIITFIPIIRFSAKYLPILIGKYRI